MKCSQCGRIIDDDSIYCDYCGTKVQQANTLKKEPQITDAAPLQTTPHAKQSVPKVRKDSSSAPKWIGVIVGVLIITIIAVGALYMGPEGSAGDDYVAVDTVAEVYGEVDSETGASQQQYVDLGLPSGTRWKDQNEEGFYDYDEAVEQFGDNLPSKKQLDELFDECRWIWTGDGYNVIGSNGNQIFLPAEGARDCEGNVNSVGCFGGYWSHSSGCTTESAWYLDFAESEVDVYDDNRCYGLSVRLVR